MSLLGVSALPLSPGAAGGLAFWADDLAVVLLSSFDEDADFPLPLEAATGDVDGFDDADFEGVAEEAVSLFASVFGVSAVSGISEASEDAGSAGKTKP